MYRGCNIRERYKGWGDKRIA